MTNVGASPTLNTCITILSVIYPYTTNTELTAYYLSSTKDTAVVRTKFLLFCYLLEHSIAVILKYSLAILVALKTKRPILFEPSTS